MGFLSHSWRYIRWSITQVPIYGQLINSSPESRREATTDLFTATLFSLLPLWFYPIISMFAYGTEFWSTVQSFVSGGELFLYSAALVGPLIFSITRKYGEFSSPDENNTGSETTSFPRRYTIQFPYGIWFVLISALVLGFSAYFFGILRDAAAVAVDSTPNSAETIRRPNEENLLLVSIIMYVFTLSCFYCVSVYRLQLDDAAKEFGSDTRDLMEEWGRKNA